MPINTQIRTPDGDLAYIGEASVPVGSPFRRVAIGTLFDIDVAGFSTAYVQWIGSYDGQALLLEVTRDGSIWKQPTVLVANKETISANFGGYHNAGMVASVPLEGASRLRANITIAPTSGEIVAAVTLCASPHIIKVTGPSPHEHAKQGNPFPIAGRAATSSYTSVASGRVADLISTVDGRLVVLPGAIPENTWSYAAASGGITNTTAVTIKAAAASGVRNYTSWISLKNVSAVKGACLLRDGSVGTVLGRFILPASMLTHDFIPMAPPLRGTAATLLEVVMDTTAMEVYVNAGGWIAP